jgi:Rod binding domain-containing protein
MNQISLAQADPRLLADSNLKQTDSPAKIHDAAQQFEGLLLAQILGSVHQGGGWLGSSDDSSSAATGFAEQQLAGMIAQKGGLGLSNMIAAGLQRDSDRLGST